MDGSSTIIKNKENGFICSLNNSKEWTDIILKIVRDETYKNTISENAEKTIKNEFTWDKLSDKFLELYLKEKNQNRGN